MCVICICAVSLIAEYRQRPASSTTTSKRRIHFQFYLWFSVFGLFLLRSIRCRLHSAVCVYYIVHTDTHSNHHNLSICRRNMNNSHRRNIVAFSCFYYILLVIFFCYLHTGPPFIALLHTTSFANIQSKLAENPNNFTSIVVFSYCCCYCWLSSSLLLSVDENDYWS